MPVRVLFTRGLSNVYDAIRLLREAMHGHEFYLAASYYTERTALRAVADTVIVEPELRNDDAYLRWLIATCREHHINLLWPQSRLQLILAQRDRLAAAGIAVLFPSTDPETFELIGDKARTAEALLESDVQLPVWRSFRTANDFDAAVETIRAQGLKVCVKPAVSIFGQGFRVLDDARDAFSRFIRNDTSAIGTPELRGLLEANHGGKTFLAMEYLEGDERSIDCLALDGTLVQSITRLKPKAAHGRWQVIDDNAESKAIATTVCKRFGLNGIVNIQTRERILPAGGRVQCFLEVNPRMSGGIAMACQSGVILPYWALRLAAGTAKPGDIPAPATGRLVTTIIQALSIDEPVPIIDANVRPEHQAGSDAQVSTS